ncbi:MAG TPA: hypothetical protein VM432_01200 [Bdellovibrionales bacterium]|nr:hypothetical protein [Bdellovibrionales bacterium]
MVAIASTVSFSAFAKRSAPKVTEPAYCNYDAFKKLERGNNVPNIKRVHVFQVGQLTLAGLAVGQSQATFVRTLAEQYSKYKGSEKSCVWYYNDGNDEAAEMFNQRYVSNPIFKSEKVADEFDSVLKNIFSKDETSMLSCAQDHKFIAMGCDGQRHRGPSVFAMLLSYSGCSPESATNIANKVWGTNFVSTKTRTAIARKGWEIGNADPAGRAALQKIMTTPAVK